MSPVLERAMTMRLTLSLIERRLTLLTWMVGANTKLLLVVLGGIFL